MDMGYQRENLTWPVDLGFGGWNEMENKYLEGEVELREIKNH